MISDNHLLRQLDAATASKVAAALSPVLLQQHQELAHPHQTVDKVYFPQSGIISCVVELPGGSAVETGMIGCDGEWGASQALDDKISLNSVVVQVAGRASAIEVDALSRLANELPDFRGLLLRYEQFFTAQVQQTAACNAIHSSEQRLCRWLLRMHDLVGREFAITQEFMAQMMGVTRSSVTIIAQGLQRAGAIAYSRGKLRVVDADRLRQHGCDCIAELDSHFERLFQLPRMECGAS